MGEDTIASIEQGRRALQLDLAVQLDELLDTKGALRVAVEKIPRKERYQALVRDFVQYEQDALSLLRYETQLIPGLLQTEAYARFIFGCNYPPTEEEEIEKRVAERLDRQKILERKPGPVLHFTLEESILHTELGDPEVMREQLLHLRRCMDLPFVTIQIMPRNTPRHAGLSGPLVLLEAPDHDQLAYISGQLRAELYDEPADVSALMQRYGMLRSQALTVEEGTRLLGRTACRTAWRDMPRAAHTAPCHTALRWFKSSYSDGDGGACVEIAAHPAAIHIRDSKVTDGPVLTVEPAAWSAFIHGSGTAL